MTSRKQVYGPSHTTHRAKWYDTKEVAKILDKSESTVKSWRRLHKGPAWHRFEGGIRYSTSDLKRYVDEQRHN